MLWLWVVATVSFGLAQSSPTVSADPTEIDAGQSSTISWHVERGDVFISGIGTVPASGSAVVHPDTTTDYVLIAQNGERIESTRVTVTVKGAKGNEAFPDVEDFKSAPIVAEHHDSSYPAFLSAVERTLQDTFHFHVHGDFLPSRPYVTLFTDRSIRPELLRPTDRGIRRRRVAYAVRVNQPTHGIISYEIRTMVEYQRMSEIEWRPETDADLLRAATDRLRAALETNSKQ